MNRLRQNWHRVLAHATALLLLAWMLADFALHLEDYSANRALMLRSGSVGLALLVASFACSPLAALLHRPQLTQIRRALGLYGFLFVGIHLLVYVWLDNAFDLELIVRDLGERRAMSVGLIAFALLIPLAITSTQRWQRRMGRRWRMLHRLVLIALPLSVLHYLLLDRDVLDAAWVFAAVVGVLLLARLPVWRRWARNSRTLNRP